MKIIFLAIMVFSTAVLSDDCRIKYEGFNTDFEKIKTSKIDKMVRSILRKKGYQFNDHSNYEYELRIKEYVNGGCSQSDPSEPNITIFGTFNSLYSNAVIKKSYDMNNRIFARNKIKNRVKRFVKSIPHCKQYKRSN